ERLDDAAVGMDDVGGRADESVAAEDVAGIDIDAGDGLDREVAELNEFGAAGMGFGVRAAAEVTAAPVGDPLVGGALKQPQQPTIGRGGDAEAGLHVGKRVEAHGCKVRSPWSVVRSPQVFCYGPRTTDHGLNLLLLFADDDGESEAGRGTGDGADVADVGVAAVEGDGLVVVGGSQLGEGCASDVAPGGVVTRLLDLAIEGGGGARDGPDLLDGKAAVVAGQQVAAGGGHRAGRGLRRSAHAQNHL